MTRDPMRHWLNTAARLDEAAGTLGFFRPRDGKEILVRGDHADYLLAHPAEFDISEAEIRKALAQPLDDPYASPKMIEMRKIINLAMRKGWVRVNYHRTAMFFCAATLKLAHAALKHYFEEDLIEEAVLDIGPDAGKPTQSESIYPWDRVKQFVRTGKIPG